MANYSMWVLEYAHVPTQAIGSVLAGQYNQGVRLLAFGYMVLKGEGHTIMIDTGLNPVANGEYIKLLVQRDNVLDWQPPEKVLAKVGIKPEEVDTVILTHAHYDHMDNLTAFKNAHFYIQKRELNDWIWAASLPERYKSMLMAINPDDLVYAKKLVDEGRMTLLDGDVDYLLPGISLRTVYDSHTFASQMVVIENSEGSGQGKWVNVGDLAYVRDNLTGIDKSGIFNPIGLAVGAQYNMLKAYDQMLEITGGKLERVIIGHETDNWNLYSTWQTTDGLHVSELNLAPGEKSRKA